jgi:Family of unknown function (DUF5681)
MPANLLQKQVGRRQDGRFAKGRSGNPAGRATGSRNRATLIAEAMLDDEAAGLIRKAVELALGGDGPALRLCVDRIVAPRRERPVPFAWPPITGAADIPAAMSAVAAGVALGTLSPGEAFALSQVIDTFIRAIEAGEFERRLQLLENAGGERPNGGRA